MQGTETMANATAGIKSGKSRMWKTPQDKWSEFFNKKSGQVEPNALKDPYETYILT